MSNIRWKQFKITGWYKSCFNFDWINVNNEIESWRKVYTTKISEIIVLEKIKWIKRIIRNNKN